MKYIIKTFRLTVIFGFAIFVASCSNEGLLQPDYSAPDELPSNIVPGSLLNDRIIKLYNDYGIVVYTDVSDPRMYKDLVSEDGLNITTDRIPVDTLAAITYIDMIENEFINNLPVDKINIIPRNFYLFKDDLIVGSSANGFEYLSKLWYNSNGDLTVGGLNNNRLDSVKLKQTFYYGLSNILRNDVINSNTFYTPFVDIKTKAAVYAWQVTSLEDAYERGFLSANKNLINSDQQDFDLYAAWASTTPVTTKDSIFNLYPLVKQKYALVNAMFKKEGIDLKIVNQKWQESTYNPKNN